MTQLRNNLVSSILALALCYSVIEYCCQVRSRFGRTTLIGTQLQSSMHLTSGHLGPILVSWLHVVYWLNRLYSNHDP